MPAALVVVSDLIPVSTWVATTVAPGRMAPCGSVTLPLMRFALCGSAVETTRNVSEMNTSRRAESFVIDFSYARWRSSYALSVTWNRSQKEGWSHLASKSLFILLTISIGSLGSISSEALAQRTHRLKAAPGTVAWGYYDGSVPPVL